IAILAILKSGKIYSVLDLVNPPERLQYMLSDLGARVIITDTRSAGLAHQVAAASIPIIDMDRLKGEDRPILVERPADSTMAVYYTSGSTGQPKGVIQTHRSLLHLVTTIINQYRVCPNDRETLAFSCSYSSSIHPVFGTLLCGASLHLIDLKS